MATLKFEIELEIPTLCTCGEVLEQTIVSSREIVTLKPCRCCMKEQYEAGYRKGKEESQ